MLSVILLCMLMILLSTLSVSRYQVYDIWQQLQLTSELDSDLRDIVNWSREWIVDFNYRKIQLVSFEQSKTSGAVDVKKDESVLGEKSSLKILRLSFSSKLGQSSYIACYIDNFGFDLLYQGFGTQSRFASLNLSIFIVNNFYFVINCLK